MLDWSQQRLADESKIGNATIRNFESGKSKLQHATEDVLTRTFVDAGIIFLDDGTTVDGGPGVRLK